MAGLRRTSKRKMDTEDIKEQWLLQNEKICICKGIPRKRVVEAINSGALSLQDINRIVGTGSGDCRGERCGPRIEKMLVEYQAAAPKIT